MNMIASARKRSSTVALAVAAIMVATTPAPTRAQTEITEQEAHAIGVDAYLYFYPLISTDVTLLQSTNMEPGKEPLKGPMNTFLNAATYPSAEMKIVVRPNFDTLYSLAWLDLTKEPMIVSAPDTGGRYYLLPMLDMWSDVFAVPGKRTSGTTAASYVIVPPGWNGTLPSGVERIHAPTPYVWIIGRTQTNGPKDYPAVHKVQDGYRMVPLSQWGKTPTPVTVQVDPSVDMKTPPLRQVNDMPVDRYFAYAAELMKVNPPHITDWSTLARLKRIGIEPGRFDPGKADPAALARGARAGLKLMQDKGPTLARVVNGWQM